VCTFICKGSVCALALGVLLCLSGRAPAASIFLSTAPGAQDSAHETVVATALIVTSADTVNVTLQNLTANPKSVGQNISDFSFNLTGGDTSLASITSSSGRERTVASDGTFTDGSAVATAWSLDSAPAGFIHLDVLGTPEAPKHTILGTPDGSNVYSNANDSIAKTGGPHNPFLAGPVTFTLSVPGVTTGTSVNLTNAFFSFGTTAGDNVAAVPTPKAAAGGLVLVAALWLRKVRAAVRP